MPVGNWRTFDHRLRCVVVRLFSKFLGDILNCIDPTGSLKNADLQDIQIRLDVLCLYLPEELKHIPPLDGRSAMRTISGGSSAINIRGSDSDISTIQDGCVLVTDHKLESCDDFFLSFIFFIFFLLTIEMIKLIREKTDFEIVVSRLID